MSNTVQQFAAELKKSVPTLLEQLKAAGVEKSSGADSISPADKQALLTHLRKQNDSGTVSISVSRTRTERSTVAYKWKPAAAAAWPCRRLKQLPKANPLLKLPRHNRPHLLPRKHLQPPLPWKNQMFR